nr:cut9-interacting protein scn1 [Quercus suber]
MSQGDSDQNDFPPHLGVFDAHCHPTDTLASLPSIPSMRANVLTVMSTRAQDQELVARTADEHGLAMEDVQSYADDWSNVHKIIPAFGWHPWFSHQMFDESDYDGAIELSRVQKIAHYQSVLTPKSEDENFLATLPDPQPFGHFLEQTRSYLDRYPLALIGEVGLDRSFRIPEVWLPEEADQRDDALTPGGREGRKLSPYRVSIEHQRKVLTAQLRLAGEMQRAVSCHGVAAHGLVYETIAATWKGHERKVSSKRERRKADGPTHLGEGLFDDDEPPSNIAEPYPPRICLHSFSGPSETVKQYLAPSVPCEVFFSFSTTINAWSDSGDGKVEAAVRAVPDDKVLVESDLHTAGERMDGYLEDAIRKLCQIKEWGLEDGIRQLGDNWMRFALGFSTRHPSPTDGTASSTK